MFPGVLQKIIPEIFYFFTEQLQTTTSVRSLFLKNSHFMFPPKSLGIS